MTEGKVFTMRCVICGGILDEGICIDQKDHWRHMSPEEIKGALEKLQQALAVFLGGIVEMVNKDD